MEGIGATKRTELTGSQPGAAENPLVLQPGFEPEVMSVSTVDPFEYSSGLRKPRVDLFEARR